MEAGARTADAAPHAETLLERAVKRHLAMLDRQATSCTDTARQSREWERTAEVVRPATAVKAQVV